jgi:hypothetical protein
MKYLIPIGNTEAEMDVEYSVSGKFIPASMSGPEENPELEVQSISYQGIEVPYWMFSLLLDEVTTACWEDHAEQAAEVDDDDYHYRCWSDSSLDARWDAEQAA